MYLNLSSQIGILQDRVRDSQVSKKDHHDILKSELARRDETIQKLRRDVLALQEKRDAAVSEVRFRYLLQSNYIIHYIFLRFALICNYSVENFSDIYLELSNNMSETFHLEIKNRRIMKT